MYIQIEDYAYIIPYSYFREGFTENEIFGGRERIIQTMISSILHNIQAEKQKKVRYILMFLSH
jgi:hypothetical protein